MQTAQELSRLSRFGEAQLEYTGFQMAEEAGHRPAIGGGLAVFRRSLRLRGLWSRLQARHTDLVAEDLHGRRQVERGILRIGRDIHQVVTAVQFLVAEPRAFPTKHQGHRPKSRLGQQQAGRFPGVELRPGNRTQAGAGAHHQAAIGQGLIQAGIDLGSGQEVIRPRGPGGGLGTRKGLGVDQAQPPQTHGFHRPGRRADVSRMGGVHEKDIQMIQHAGKGTRSR